jgi:hypothetical protein
MYASIHVEVFEVVDLVRALLHVDEQLEDVGLLLRRLEEQRAGHALHAGEREVGHVVAQLADVEVGEAHLERGAL